MKNKEKRNDVLYSLCLEDIYTVAEDEGIDKDKITPEVISLIQKGWESGLAWYEVTQIALGEALRIVEEEGKFYCEAHGTANCLDGVK